MLRVTTGIRSGDAICLIGVLIMFFGPRGTSHEIRVLGSRQPVRRGLRDRSRCVCALVTVYPFRQGLAGLLARCSPIALANIGQIDVSITLAPPLWAAQRSTSDESDPAERCLP